MMGCRRSFSNTSTVKRSGGNNNDEIDVDFFEDDDGAVGSIEVGPHSTDNSDASPAQFKTSSN